MPLPKNGENDVFKPAKGDPTLQVLLHQEDIWVGKILPFLGPGHFVFLAGVNKQMKQLYKGYCRSIGKTPEHTNNQSVFSSVSRAEYWEKYDFIFPLLVCRKIAATGNVNTLIWARNKGYPWNARTCQEAANYGNLEVLEYLHENGCEWDEMTCMAAAGAGNLDCFKYARQNGCLEGQSSMRAARKGQLEVLKYIRENAERNRDDSACLSAAQGGQLKVLMYLHETDGLYKSSLTCHIAAREGHLTTLKYVHENGCPLDDAVWNAAVKVNNEEVLEYLREMGCPGSD